MASMTRRNSVTVLQFFDADGRRRTMTLGRLTAKQADRLRSKIEPLITASLTGESVDDDIAVWVSKLPAALADKLAAVDLIPRRETALLGAFVDGYLDQRADVKPGTLIVMRQARIWLCRFLGGDRRIDRVTVADADSYRAHMIGSGLARATVAKRLRYARHFFEVAKRRGMVRSNPFEHMKRGTITTNPERRVFVPGEIVQKVIDSIPDPQWKLLIALGRWGGLRVPSEALALTWRDVDFAGKRFVVRASKTEHHQGGGVRIVPMFPELVEPFQAVFDTALEGDTYVITRYRSAGQNLRTQFLRYIEAAGAKPWPKPWQNLRVSRATELADEFPSHVCAGWLGHSEVVADSFYRMTTDEHFAKATAGSAAQALHQPAADRSNRSQAASRNAAECGDLRPLAIRGNKNMGPAGFEPATKRL